MPAEADSTSTSHYQHLKGLDFMVGEWTGGGVNSDGVEFQITAKHEWTLNKNALSEVVHFTQDGQPLVTVRELIYWDQADKRVKVFTLTSLGEVLRGRVIIDDGSKCVQRKSGWYDQGKTEVRGELGFTKQGDDVIRAKASFKRADGDEGTMGFSCVFNRVTN
jgi:hypothetical protein